ncbi:MAG: hypothetical protein CM1200mP41_22610 [Gammaproteobacteria bacterium]|nr:MAG: hypothetical protein CM1200mP41_22610 [Gammaproteobacteria bacterium]
MSRRPLPHTVGSSVSLSVRADCVVTGTNSDMANRIDATYVATEYLGSLETEFLSLRQTTTCMSNNIGPAKIAPIKLVKKKRYVGPLFLLFCWTEAKVT